MSVVVNGTIYDLEGLAVHLNRVAFASEHTTDYRKQPFSPPHANLNMKPKEQLFSELFPIPSEQPPFVASVIK